MKDQILSGIKDGLWYGLYYINHPTPSGSARPMLKYSTNVGFKTPREAIILMRSAFTAEQLKDIDCPDVTEPLDEDLFIL